MGNKHKGTLEPLKQGMLVQVRDNRVDAALRKLKRRMAQEGLVKDMRKKTYYESPSELRVKRKAQARSRWQKKLKTMQEIDQR